MLFLNMIALLAYTVLQRQMQQRGMQLTTRRLIQRLEPLTIIETTCWDGSSLRRLTPDDPDLLVLLELVATALDDLVQARHSGSSAKGAAWRNSHVASTSVARLHALLSRFDRKAPVCHRAGG
jgi:hypothetical protein